MNEHLLDDNLPDEIELDAEQKRRLRAVRKGYRAHSAVVKDNGWKIEVTYLDGSTITVNAKLLKLRAPTLVEESSR